MKDSRSLEKLFRVFSNRRRLNIIKILIAQDSASIEDLASELKLSYKAAYQHIARLVERGILDKERNSSGVVYFLEPNMDKIARILVNLIRRR